MRQSLICWPEELPANPSPSPVSGLRGGLADDRGNLALTYCRILQKFRPKWFLWENVPGVLSSSGGRDFGSILGAMEELGYGVAYRVLDAQYFGVPQRRRRVFVVGCLGNWRRAAEVLFEPGCVSGDSKASRKKRKAVAGTIASRTSAGGGLGTDFDLSGALQVASTGIRSHCLNAGGMGRQDYETETMVVENMSYDWQKGNDDKNPRPSTMNVSVGQTQTLSGTRVPAVGVRRLTPRECERLQGFPTCIERVTIDACLDHQKNNVHVVLQCRKSPSNVLRAEGSENTALALSADTVLWNDRESRDAHAAVHVRMSHGPLVAAIRSVEKWIWCASGAGNQNEFPLPVRPDDFAHAIAVARQELESSITGGKEESRQQLRRFTLPALGRWRAAMFGLENEASASDAESSREEAMRFITSNLGRSINRSGLSVETWLCFALDVTSSCIQKPTQPRNSFRVVLDVESDWTLVTHRNKPAADGPRYKAIGNSMAVPVIRWICKRIQEND